MKYNAKTIASMFLPAFFESASGVLLSTLNTILVSNVGEFAISATSLVTNIYLMATCFFSGIGTGIIVRVSQNYGAKKMEECEKNARQGIALSVSIGIVIGTLLLIFGNTVIRLLFGGADEAVLKAANTYLTFLSISFPFNALYNAANSVVYGTGDFKRTFMHSLRANIINCSSSALLICVFKLGVLGVGIGAVLSPLISSFLVYRRLRKGTEFIQIRSAFLIPDRTIVGSLLSISIPTAFDSVAVYISNILLSTVVVKMGSIATAAYGITTSISNVLLLFATATTTVSVTLIGRLYGAGEYRQCRRYSVCMIGFAIALATATCVGVWFMRDIVIGLYNPMPDTFAAIRSVLTVMVFIHSFLWAPGFVSPAALRGCDDVRYSTTVSICALVTKIPSAWFFGVHLGMGIIGLWYAVAIEWSIRIIFILPRIFSSKLMNREVVSNA